MKKFGSYILFFVFLAFPFFCYAEELAEKICDIREMMCSGAGMAIASAAVMVIGIGALNGKVNWMMVLVTTIGLTVFFSADVIVEMLSDDEADVSSNCTCL